MDSAIRDFVRLARDGLVSTAAVEQMLSARRHVRFSAETAVAMRCVGAPLDVLACENHAMFTSPRARPVLQHLNALAKERKAQGNYMIDFQFQSQLEPELEKYRKEAQKECQQIEKKKMKKAKTNAQRKAVKAATSKMLEDKCREFSAQLFEQVSSKRAKRMAQMKANIKNGIINTVNAPDALSINGRVQTNCLSQLRSETNKTKPNALEKAREGARFEASEAFEGKREGMVFTSGPQVTMFFRLLPFFLFASILSFHHLSSTFYIRLSSSDGLPVLVSISFPLYPLPTLPVVHLSAHPRVVTLSVVRFPLPRVLVTTKTSSRHMRHRTTTRPTFSTPALYRSLQRGLRPWKPRSRNSEAVRVTHGCGKSDVECGINCRERALLCCVACRDEGCTYTY